MATNGFGSLFEWPRDKEAVCARIMDSKAVLKIVLKTRDEIELLPLWLAWHKKVCAPENIIVFDHGSVHPEIADIYRSNPNLLVCRYEGHVDTVHHRELFAELREFYDALSQSSKYSVFIDTDEFLTLATSAIAHDRSAINQFLQDNSEIEVFPCTWQYSLRGSRTRVHLSYWDDMICGTGMLWGKPLVPANTKLFDGFVLHNEFIARLTSATRVRNNFILLHLNSYSRTRQIRVSLHKMEHRQIIPFGSTVEQALALAERPLADDAPGVKDLRDFKALVEDERPWSEPESCHLGSAQYAEDGRIVHPTGFQAQQFQDFLDDTGFYFRLIERWRRR